MATKTITGRSACPGYVVGVVRNRPSQLKKGDILRTEMTDPSIISHLSKLGGIITAIGGVTCHAAVIAREFNIPTIVGIGNDVFLPPEGAEVRLDATKGEVSWEQD